MVFYLAIFLEPMSPCGKSMGERVYQCSYFDIRIFAVQMWICPVRILQYNYNMKNKIYALNKCFLSAQYMPIIFLEAEYIVMKNIRQKSCPVEITFCWGLDYP